MAVIDLDAYAANIRVIRSLVNPDARLLAVVKANAYGHGAVPLAKIAIEAGAGALGVATVDEGVQLRLAGIDAPILVFGAIGHHELARAIGFGLELVVSDAAFAGALANAAKAGLHTEPIDVHLKIDTGMRRFGIDPGDALDAAREILAHPELRFAGLMSHQASADAASPDPARQQQTVFDGVVEALSRAGIDVPMQHLANSAALLRFPDMQRGQVRTGIITYGLDPDPDLRAPEGVRPIATIFARIMRVFEIGPGDRVGYGGTYAPTRREMAALIPLGYADGYRRDFSNRAWMSVSGHRADVIGRVSMDQCVIRLPEGIDARVGDIVTVVGDGSSATPGAPTFNELAILIGTLPYELTCDLSLRLPRIYIRDGQVVGIADLFGYRDLA